MLITFIRSFTLCFYMTLFIKKILLGNYANMDFLVDKKSQNNATNFRPAPTNTSIFNWTDEMVNKIHRSNLLILLNVKCSRSLIIIHSG